MQQTVASQEEFTNLISQIAQTYRASYPKPYIFLLNGDMGVGKTQAAKAIAQVFHVKQNVKSPTFAYSYEYLSENDNLRLIHWDLWRLEQESFSLSGFSNAFENFDVVIVEWWSKFEKEIKEIIKLKQLNGLAIQISNGMEESDRVVEWKYL